MHGKNAGKKIHINVLYTLTSANMATVQNNEVIPGKLNVVTVCTVRNYVQNWAIKLCNY